MKQHSKRSRERRQLVGISALLLVAAIGVDAAKGSVSWTSVVLGVLALVIVHNLYRSREQLSAVARRQPHDWQQAQHLAGLYACLPVRLPLPAMREWAASPDLLAVIVQHALTRKPACVVEASCGVSSIALGYVMEQLEKDGHSGRVISLEQDADYAARCQQQIVDHGLEAFVSVIHAPISDHDGVRWYDTSALPDGLSIDMLIVDGPSPDRQSGSLVREPALPILHSRLSDGALIVLDDGARETERRTIESWQAQYPALKASYLELEKGAWEVRLG